jgi:hypothetical protein
MQWRIIKLSICIVLKLEHFPCEFTARLREWSVARHPPVVVPVGGGAVDSKAIAILFAQHGPMEGLVKNSDDLAGDLDCIGNVDYLLKEHSNPARDRRLTVPGRPE